MFITIENVTPEMAGAWLDTSRGNPRWKTDKVVDRRKVEKIKHDILEGEWIPSGSTIQFGEDGCLIDGHHRLTAIKESGVACISAVARGVPKEAEFHIDDNDKRLLAVRLGVDYGVAALAPLGLSVENGVVTPDKFSDTERSAWLDRHPDAAKVYTITQKGSGANIIKKSPCALGMLYAYEYGVSITKLEDFARCVNTGYAIGLGATAAITLRNTLLKKEVHNNAWKVKICADTQNAIYDFVNEIPRTRAYMKTTGWYFEQLKAMGNPRYGKGAE